MNAAADHALPATLSSKPRGAQTPPELRLRANYRPDIDGLRALAIIPVVIFHAFPAIMPGGFVGVDVFFVISGFLISTILWQGLERETFTFTGFYANRIRRIFPALLIVLVACFALGWFFLLADEYRQLGKHILGSAGYAENFVLRREAGYFDTKSFLKPLMHVWSLSIEEQFYMTYPLLLWMVWHLRRNLFAVLLTLGIVSFALNLWLVRRDPVSAFFLPETRWWELMTGGAIAYWRLPGQRPNPSLHVHWLSRITASLRISGARVSNACSTLGMLLIVIAVFGIHESDPFPGWRALLPVGGAALLILGGPAAWINRKLLALKPMVFVGLISYPLYLWHWPILTFPRILRGADLPVTVRSIGVLLSFVLAWTTWRYIESPIRFGRKTWIKSAALVATSVVIGSLGYLAYSRDGFSSRFPNLSADLGLSQQIPWSTPECRRTVGLDLDYCRSAAPGAPDVLLIGDSHSVSLYRGLAPAYLQHSQNVMNIGQANCVPFYDTESYSTGIYPPRECKPVVNRILQFAESTTSVRTIILSLRGPLYISGHGFGQAEAGLGPRRIVWDGTPPNSSQLEIFAGALSNTVARLSATGKTIIVFIDWPELGFDPRSCLPRPVRLFGNPPAVCGVPRTEVDARNRAYRDVIFKLKRDFPLVRVFDPLPYFCDSSVCFATKAGHVLYRDDNHLSAAGAAYLSEKFFEEDQSLHL